MKNDEPIKYTFVAGKRLHMALNEAQEVMLMENRKIVLYVLHGAWNTEEYDGCSVLGVSEQIESLEKKLREIAANHASEYVVVPLCTACQEYGERHYEISGSNGRYAKFYITEHWVELSETLMGAICQEVDRVDRINDIKEHLRALHENGDLEPWKYAYINTKPEVIEEILACFYKYEDCNISLNVALENAVEKIVNELTLDENDRR